MTDINRVTGIGNTRQKFRVKNKQQLKQANGNSQQRNATSLVPSWAYIPGMSQVKVSKPEKGNEPLYSRVYQNEQNNQESLIGVLDRYNGSMKEIGIKLDIDTTYDLAHGDLVNEYIKNGGQNIKTQRLEARDSVDVTSKRLEAIENKEYWDYDALNISMSVGMKYSDIESELGVKGVTPENLAEKRDEIVKSLSTNPEYEDTYKAIRSIENIVKDDTAVYIAAGNESDEFNLLTLAKGSVSVGALETTGPNKGKPMEGFSHNSEIDLYYPGKFPISKVKGSDEVSFGRNNHGKLDPDKEYFNVGGGKKGGSTGDGTVLYPEEAASYVLPFNIVWGSSFATPNAITENPDPYKVDWSKVDKKSSWEETLKGIYYD